MENCQSINQVPHANNDIENFTPCIDKKSPDINYDISTVSVDCVLGRYLVDMVPGAIMSTTFLNNLFEFVNDLQFYPIQ